MVHDDEIETMRAFLITVHYTHELEDDQKDLRLDVYIGSKNSIISAVSNQECNAHRLKLVSELPEVGCFCYCSDT